MSIVMLIDSKSSERNETEMISYRRDVSQPRSTDRKCDFSCGRTQAGTCVDVRCALTLAHARANERVTL